MRNLLLLSIMMLGLWCCQKEDSITPDLKLENLYAVKDDASDTIQQRVYDIYEKYKVTVVFNDTIGKVFVKMNAEGDSVFTYETVDPAYSFTGYTDLDYQYALLRDPMQKSQLLDVVESYLSSCNKNLYPQVILLTNMFEREDNRGGIENFFDGAYLTTYRSLILSYTSDEAILSSLPGDILRTFIINRIGDYATEVQQFHRVSKDFIGKEWDVLGVSTLREPVTYMEFDYWYYDWVEYTITEFYEAPLYSSCTCLQDDWWGIVDYADYVEDFRNAVRQLIGPFGFVMESAKAQVGAPPVDQEDDLQVFVKEMLRFSYEEFETLWGDYPLVMQKYEILYDLLTNEFGVEL